VSVTDVAERLAAVRERIARAAASAGRSPDEVTLVGITKTHPPEVARAAVAAGLVDLGENRVDEAVAKAAVVDGARWHFVGRLQSRKANQLVGRGWLIHSVDRRSLVDRIARLAERDGAVQRVLVQVNVGDDPAKGGCGLGEVPELVAYARDRSSLAVEGLMTVPPLPPEGADPTAAARPHFARLRELRDELRTEAPEVRELSMGMTADLEAAVAEGATLVRVGTALFGSRGPQPWRP
jgi:pyridoxal phosphate enzyme (YggS family)